MSRPRKDVRSDPAAAARDAGAAGGKAGVVERTRTGAASAPAAPEGKPGASGAPTKGAGRFMLLLFGLPLFAIVLALVLRSGCGG